MLLFLELLPVALSSVPPRNLLHLIFLSGALVNRVVAPLVAIEHSIKEVFVLESVVPKDVLKNTHLLEGLAKFDGVLSARGSSTLDQVIDGFGTYKDLFVGLESKHAILELDIFLEFESNVVQIHLEKFGAGLLLLSFGHGRFCIDSSSSSSRSSLIGLLRMLFRFSVIGFMIFREPRHVC